MNKINKIALLLDLIAIIICITAIIINIINFKKSQIALIIGLIIISFSNLVLFLSNARVLIKQKG